MPKIFFDPIEPGAIPVYGEISQYAICRDYIWHVHCIDLQFCPITLHPRPLIPTLEFYSRSAPQPPVPGFERPKFQTWLRQRVSEMNMDGLFILPFFHSVGKNWADFTVAGLLFIPASCASPFQFHFEGSPKEIASYAYKIIHSPWDSQNPFVRATAESYAKKSL